MKRRSLGILLVAACAFAIPGSMPNPVDAQNERVVLRIATLAPDGSSWMRVFNMLRNDVYRDTNQRLRLQFFPGGALGDERDFVAKMRAGQIDGAALTSTGLGMVVRNVLVLAAPGLVTDYRTMDRVRDAMKEDLEKEFLDNDYKLLGWGDVGETRLFTRGSPVARPADLRRHKPWAWTDDPLFSQFLVSAGVPTTDHVRLGVPEVLGSLSVSNGVTAVPGSALAVRSLQWGPRLQYMTQQNSGILIGATILRKDKFNALPADLKAKLMELSGKAHGALATLIRRDDAAAYRALKRNLQEVDTNAHRAEWEDVGKRARCALVGRLFSADMLNRVRAAVGSGGGQTPAACR